MQALQFAHFLNAFIEAFVAVLLQLEVKLHLGRSLAEFEVITGRYLEIR